MVEASGNIGSDKEGESQRIFDPEKVATFTDVERFLASDVEAVSICTHTDSHVELAMRALAAGKHVLVEKPVAIKSVDVARLAVAARAAQKAGRLCMPAMCMRFWPGWEEAREVICDGRYGKVLSATFQRLGSGPTWGGGFYKDFSRSGGAVIDLHIHDTDFIVWCFGRPASVKSCGDGLHITTQYVYPQGPSHVVAEGAWDLSPGAGFRMRYLINLERASLEFDLSKTPMAMVHHAEKSEPLIQEEGGRQGLSGYDGEVRHFVRSIEGGSGLVSPSIDDALMVAQVLEAEMAAQGVAGVSV